MATSNPPMIAKAIGPQNTEHNGSKPGAARIDNRLPDVFALRPLGFDLTYQDNGVLCDHTEQRQDAEYGDEAKWLSRHEERGDDPNKTQRPDGEDEKQSLETSQFEHQDREHHEEH